VRSALEALDMAALLETCGITSEMLEQVAQKIRNAKGFLSFYCMGLGQSTSGTMKCQSLINLHLLTGQIGKTGSGPFSMTGQPNAMGGREVGGLAHLLPGYRLIENETHRHEVEDVWGVARGSIRPKNGLTAVEIFQGLESGRIKAVWIVCNNAMVSLPNLDQVRRALGKAELIVAQDCFETETTHIAHIVLPAAQWIERTSTMTNSERRVSRNPQLAKPYFQSKPDWWIFSEVAKRLGFENAFSYRNSEEIWDEFRTLTRGRPCDMFGMTNERLAQAPLQWPCPTVDHPGTPRRYTDKKFATPDGKANFVVAHYQPPAELPSSEYPLVLSTGRLASQWHTMTRTGKVARLKKQLPEAFIEMSPSDASELNLRADDEVWVQSARGEARVRIKLSNKQRPGNVFMPFHWGGMFAPGGEANNLTNSAFDPISKEPEYKVCAVRLVPKN
jgi:ferredoxin-nitrate reductase